MSSHGLGLCLLVSSVCSELPYALLLGETLCLAPFHQSPGYALDLCCCSWKVLGREHSILVQLIPCLLADLCLQLVTFSVSMLVSFFFFSFFLLTFIPFPGCSIPNLFVSWFVSFTSLLLLIMAF